MTAEGTGLPLKEDIYIYTWMGVYPLVYIYIHIYAQYSIISGQHLTKAQDRVM